MENEQVLVIETELFEKIGRFVGFNPNARPYMDAIYNPQNVQYIDREAAEKDPRYKQIIPYAVFERTDPNTGKIQLFRYYRGHGQGESRLIGRASLGVGGHINRSDDSEDPFTAGLRREVEEEVKFVSGPGSESIYKIPSAREVGLINDESDEVGRVHLGVVLLYRIPYGNLEPKESTMLDAAFVGIADLYKTMEELEGWSKSCLQTLYPLSEYFAPEDYVGMAHAEATSLAAGCGSTCRITRLEGKGMVGTMDYVPTRLNFEVEEGRVCKVTRG